MFDKGAGLEERLAQAKLPGLFGKFIEQGVD